MNHFFQTLLSHGIGSLGKTETDALIMWHLDQTGIPPENVPLKTLSNTEAGFRTRTSSSRIRSLRYEAALRYAPDIEAEAQERFLRAVARGIWDPDAEKIVLILEDILVKEWIENRLRRSGTLLPDSLSGEAVDLSAEGCFLLLEVLFPKDPRNPTLRHAYETARAAKQLETRLPVLLQGYATK